MESMQLKLSIQPSYQEYRGRKIPAVFTLSLHEGQFRKIEGNLKKKLQEQTESS